MSSPKACILLLLDGLGDRPYRELGHQTPLEAAHTPNLDELAQRGAVGLYHADRPGVALPSEEAHFRLFGFDLAQFPGRGYLEAMGADIELDPGDVAILAHLVSVDRAGHELILKKDRPTATNEEVEALTLPLRDCKINGLTLSFVPTHGIYGILVIKGPASPFITDTDPLMEGAPIIEPEPLHTAPDREAARVTAQALKIFQLEGYRSLDGHEINRQRKREGLLPLNFIATNRAGQWQAVEPFEERWGLKGASISSGLVYRGLSTFLGLTHIWPGKSGDPAQELYGRLSTAIELSDSYQFIHVHTKVPDEAAHTKDPLKKKCAIERLDRGLGNVLHFLLAREDLLFVVASDHSTPSRGPLIHSGEPIPILATGITVRKDKVSSFDETSVINGALGQLYGADLMMLILNWMDRAKLRGLMDTPWDQPYWPGRRKNFRIS